MKTGVISLTREQHHRLDIVNKANAGFITVREAAEKLGLSERQIQRLKKETRENGPAALIHKNTGRTPKHAIAEEVRNEVLRIRKQAGYERANFNHFLELLETEKGIHLSYSTLSRLLTAEGIKSPKTRRRYKPHRRRKRRAQAGSMIQTDASPYDWLSTEKPIALHGGIDDATGQIVGLYLCENECMTGYYEVVRRMINNYGIPDAMYADRHTIFRSPNIDKAKATDTPPGVKAYETQFGRALSELGIQIIAARSPQAKGRIERLWETLQSRLPVELAIRGIRDIDAANDFLERYPFAFNSEFAVEPQDVESAFLPLEEGRDLDYILCVKEQRTLDHGQVFSYKGKRFQIVKAPYTDYLPPKAKVTVMTSPRIGIKAAYLHYVFETCPTPVKSTALKKPASPASPIPSSASRPRNAWEPQSGLAWQPGLPTYKESLEMIYEIFHRPYSNC